MRKCFTSSWKYVLRIIYESFMCAQRLCKISYSFISFYYSATIYTVMTLEMLARHEGNDGYGVDVNVSAQPSL